MADVDIAVTWLNGLRFEARAGSGHTVVLDGDGATATTPVETLLVSLASCMAADIVDIGGKMRLPIESLVVEASGDRASEPPRRYVAVRLRFEVSGVPDADEPKLRRALELSEEKYCSVIHTLRPDLDVELELVRLDSPSVERG